MNSPPQSADLVEAGHEHPPCRHAAIQINRADRRLHQWIGIALIAAAALVAVFGYQIKSSISTAEAQLKAAKDARVAWMHPRASAYTSSPLVYRGRMYVVNDNGILTVFDAASGKEIYKARVGGTGNTFSASPWAGSGKVYFLSEDGHTFVIEAGDTYVELGKSSLDDVPA